MSERVSDLTRVKRRIAGVWRSVAFVPTRRLAIAVALVAPLWLLSRLPGGVWLVLAAAVVLVVATLVDVAMLPAPRDLEVTRLLEPTIGVGDESELRYRIESRWGRPLVVSLYEALPAAQLAGGIVSATQRLPPRGAVELATTVRGMAPG